MADDRPLPPLARLTWVPRESLRANNWNPNHVSPTELDLLVTSLTENNWTQPIVRQPDGEIVDGFHRWTISERDEVAELTAGVRPGENISTRERELESALAALLDEVVLADASDATMAAVKVARDVLADVPTVPEGSILIPTVELTADDATLRMATIRHNRARGNHGVLKMADIVVDLAAMGIPDDEIASRLGMESIEVERLRQRGKMTERAVSKDGELSKAWSVEMRDGYE